MTSRDALVVIAGVLVLFGLLAFTSRQWDTARDRITQLERNEATLAHRCVIRPDGSVESCPSGTVFVDRVVAK